MKELERDEDGCMILRGAKTFSRNTARPKSSSRNKTSDLKLQATDRLVALMLKGSQADRLTKEPTCTKAEGKAFSSKRELFKHLYEKIKKLEEKRDALIEKGFLHFLSIVEKDIEIQTNILRELYVEIRQDEVISEYKKVQERSD